MYRVKRIFIEGLRSYIRQNVRNYRVNNQGADLMALCRCAASVSNFGRNEPQSGNSVGGSTRARRGNQQALAVEKPPSLSSSMSSFTILYFSTIVSLAEIMLVESGLSDAYYIATFASSLSMESGDNSHICFAFKSDDSSVCPFVNGYRQYIIVTRNRNFQRSLKALHNQSRHNRRQTVGQASPTSKARKHNRPTHQRRQGP